MKKIAIVIGHNEKAPGAVRVTDGVPEFVWNGKLADKIKEVADKEGGTVRIFRRQAGLGYSREINKVYTEVNAWGPDVALEFHFNSAASAASGTEMLFARGSRAGEPLAQRLGDAVAMTLGTKRRADKALERGDRGGRSVWSARAPAVLTEWFFGSNAADCAKADAAFDELAQTVWNCVK